MKQLIVRTITGIVYAALTIASILISKYTFVAYFGIVVAYTLFEFYRLCKKGGNQPQFVLGIVTALYLFMAFFLFSFECFNASLFFGFVPLLMLIPVIALFRKQKKPLLNVAFTLLGIVYIALPLSMLVFIVNPDASQPGNYDPRLLLGLLLILWANDSGAYIIGSWLGRNKMFEKVSPKKTWEGALGGMLLAMLLAMLYFNYFNYASIAQTLILTFLTVIAAILGDLSESLIKRSFAVKDSGAILPGHGGLLDRFDSMLFAAPVYFVMITLILN